MADAYDFGEQQDSQEANDLARQVARCVSKLKGSSKNSQLKVLAGLLEQLPQDATALGSAREALLDALIDRPILHSKHKDVRMYAAACFAQLLRIYAPNTPYEDKELEPVFELLLWSVQQVQEYQAPTFELAVSVLQTISQTKSYFLLLDWGREDLVLDWVRALLQCVNAGSSALAGHHALEVLTGLVDDESTTEPVLEVLLSHLVPPKSQENPSACQVAQAVLKASEGSIKPMLQKYLTTLILSPISSNSDLHRQCYALIYQLYLSVPQVLLPVIPHLTSELHSEEGDKRLEAAQLLGRLLSLPGNKLVSEYRDVLEALLGRYSDTQMNVRLTMLDFTPALVAAAGSEELQQQVLNAAVKRLQDYDEKVRLAAVKAVCQTSKQLLVGPTSTAAGAAGTSANAVALLAPVDALLGSLGSQEEDAAADLATGLEPQQQAAGAAAAGPAVAAAAVKDVPFVHEALTRVRLRLRDTKPAVRKAAASHFLAIFKAVVAAGDAPQVAKCCWLAARVLLCSKTDKELRAQLFDITARDGLFGAKTPPAQAAASWVRLWLSSSDVERDALLMLLGSRSRLQVDTLQFLALRRKLSSKQGVSDEPGQLDLDKACRQLAQQLPQPDRATECLGHLLAVRDNHAFAALQAALAPGASQEAHIKARADALSRVGSRSPAAEVVGQLLLWGRPAAWLATSIMAALLELVAGDPDGDQAELVRGAYQLLQALGKVAPLVFARLLPQLCQLMLSPEADLQQLGTQLLARCAAQQRKCGLLLSASPDAAVAKLVKQQLLPCLRQMSRGQPPSPPSPDAAAEEAEHGWEADPDSLSPGSQATATAVAPKAAKWAVYGLAACQDSSSSRKELEQLADDLSGSLDSGAPDTAAKLQALAVVGRLLPDAFARHVEHLLHFVTEDYFMSYLDATATAAPADGGGPAVGGRRRSGGGSMLSPLSYSSGGRSQPSSSYDTASQGSDAAAVALKAAALKALAAGCVPDSDSHDVPVETLRAAVRLSEFLEGLVEPGEEFRPAFLADASPELCGQLRLAAATALLRLARRHDMRLACSIYCALALVMQDEQEDVRAGFGRKVYRLIRHFQARPSTHQLSAKYAAMLPLAAADPHRPNKDAAARLLRGWVHERRAAVQALIAAAARGTREGGSTLQDLPEMMMPYGLYLLAHHPDFPQDEDADDPACFEPFQFMLQFMLQPLLVASGTVPAGATVPALLKMCRTLKRTADTAQESPANLQLYCLCDMATATVEGLAGQMNLQLEGLGDYPGNIILPKGLYRPLDKAERGAPDISYLPPGFEFVPDPQPAAALATPPQGAAAAAAAGAAPASTRHRGSKSRAAAAGGRGSKRKVAAAEQGQQQQLQQQKQPSKRARASEGGDRGGGGGGGRSRGRKRPAAAESDDEWGSDPDDAPHSSAQKTDQLTRRQQVLRQQKQQQQQPGQRHLQQPAGSTDSADNMELGDSEVDRHQQRQQAAGNRRQQQQQQPKQPQLKQQQLSFAPPGALADASSPAPVRRRQRAAAAADSDEDRAGDLGAEEVSPAGGSSGDINGIEEQAADSQPSPAARPSLARHAAGQSRDAAGRGGARGAGRQRQGPTPADSPIEPHADSGENEEAAEEEEQPVVVAAKSDRRPAAAQRKGGRGGAPAGRRKAAAAAGDTSVQEDQLDLEPSEAANGVKDSPVAAAAADKHKGKGRGSTRAAAVRGSKRPTRQKAA